MYRLKMNVALSLFLVLFPCTGIHAICTFPEYLRNSTWIDSDKGVLDFTFTHMTGWEFSTLVTTIQSWECFHNETGTVATLILRANTTMLYGDDNIYRAYLCLKMTPITSYSYYYYVHAPEQSSIRGRERINVILESTTVTDPEADVCNFVTDIDLSDKEYHVLIKEGFETEAIQTCPSAFFGVYSYSITDKEVSTTTCGTGKERWDVCTDRQMMTFNYTLCDTSIAYSANGSVFCVLTLTSGSYILHTVYNLDTDVDNINTHRFTCFVSSLGSDGSVITSQSPKSCTKTQTPSEQPTLPDGTVVGLNIALTPTVLCPLLTDSSEGSNAAGAIAGGTIGGIALLVIIAIVVYLCLKFNLCSQLCKKLCKRTRREATTEKTKKTTETKTNKKPSFTGSHTAEAPVDIEKMDHVRYPHWIHGPRGTAPSGTAFEKNNEVHHLPSFVVKDTEAILKPSSGQHPPVFNLTKRQENGAPKSSSKAKDLVISKSDQNIKTFQNKPSSADDVKPPAGGGLKGDSTPLSARSSNQSRATLKSPGMISLHEFDHEIAFPSAKTPSGKITHSSFGHVDKIIANNITKNKIQRASTDLSSRKSISNKTESLTGNPMELLQKSVTCMSLSNKDGIFSFDVPEVIVLEEKASDMKDGIAYDEDNQFEMEKGYNASVTEVEDDLEWKYGVEPSLSVTNKAGEPMPKQVLVKNAETDKQIINADQIEDVQHNQSAHDSYEEIEEDEDEGIVSINSQPYLDDINMDTAMSIIYSSTERDPDEMHVTLHRALTPIVE